ncbi:biotin--[acetyl-CoA-carboxylase] ligase [Parvularcula sp. LCG005]|uniref:biotin--[acetyl-CoA-carboxylase] ligase n=1 Tax=Parvularcula sp. LCG005 TaxID=3078805 RepID=UPI002941DBDB|nr:biotin--[acetyl-CoA-carboxylase] ligase [Parvularcula sp. LCG005]WOI54540.1 biotin--[acetyl-CoA-carboxylase] ligase [Parvularcula sp. LCG005]
MAGHPTPVQHAARTASTNEDARSAFDAGDSGPIWLTAEQQTGGVGRRGRAWWTGKGNFAGTLLWPVERNSLRYPAGFSFGAGLAVIEALAACDAPSGHHSLKWPNDVLQDGAKVAGILCEFLTAKGRQCVAIGIGVNLQAAPPDMPYDVAAVSDLGVTVPSETFLKALDERLTTRVQQLVSGDFAGICADWWNHAAGRMGPVTVRQGDEPRHGNFVGLGPNGELLLDQSGKIVTISAADVFIGGN